MAFRVPWECCLARAAPDTAGLGAQRDQDGLSRCPPCTHRLHHNEPGGGGRTSLRRTRSRSPRLVLSHLIRAQAVRWSLVLSSSPGKWLGLSAVKTQPLQSHLGNLEIHLHRSHLRQECVTTTCLEPPAGGLGGRGSGSRLQWYFLWLSTFHACDRPQGFCRRCPRALGMSCPPARAPWGALPGLGARWLSLENVLGGGS